MAPLYRRKRLNSFRWDEEIKEQVSWVQTPGEFFPFSRTPKRANFSQRGRSRCGTAETSRELTAVLLFRSPDNPGRDGGHRF